MDLGFWKDRKVLLTGHTGFKGTWLSLWLSSLGAKVTGVALAPDETQIMFGLTKIAEDIDGHFFDITDAKRLQLLFEEKQPEIVIHMAAQALVRRSYLDPIETFQSNAMGTATVLDAIRRTPSVRAGVMVTSDKCYENKEWVWGYRESDQIGGHDPYSASKGVSELITTSMRRSFFKPYVADGHDGRIATARAGNVIGGGDFSTDRLTPDIVQGCFSDKGTATLRNPNALRPWQHVLEPLRGYLTLAEQLCSDDGEKFADGWNFGPRDDNTRTVSILAEAMVNALGRGQIKTDIDPNAPHEANLLRLDCSKAERALQWVPIIDFKETVSITAAWYSAWKNGENIRNFTQRQITEYQARIKK
ncbi:MAG: CDP-glucose 4,6-dehydratase [Pseudomonadota bacterium]